MIPHLDATKAMIKELAELASDNGLSIIQSFHGEQISDTVPQFVIQVIKYGDDHIDMTLSDTSYDALIEQTLEILSALLKE